MTLSADQIAAKARGLFPYFQDDENLSWAFFENAGGSQVCKKQRIDRLLIIRHFLFQSFVSFACLYDTFIKKQTHPLFSIVHLIHSQYQKVPKSVVDAVSNYFVHSYAQLGAGYPAANRATAAVDDARLFLRDIVFNGYIYF